MKSTYAIAIFTISLFLSSCLKDEELIVKGKKPIYIEKSNHEKVISQAAKQFSQVGKIFTVGNRIYISDVGTGIHVIDNSNISAPKKEAFIVIYGNNDVAVKNNIMYADNASNLLAIDITDVQKVSVSKKIENVYNNNIFSPQNYEGYFECVENSKGVVIDWVDTDLLNPNCKK